MNQPTVEMRIAAALADNNIVSTKLAALITEAETAIVQAETTAKTEHARALDPALSPDLSKARAAKEDAEFAAAQLRTLLPRLQRRLKKSRPPSTPSNGMPTTRKPKPSAMRRQRSSPSTLSLSPSLLTSSAMQRRPTRMSHASTAQRLLASTVACVG